MLVLPKPSGISSEEWEKAEVNAMNEVIGLYGKTWHFWQIDRGDQLPLGKTSHHGRRCAASIAELYQATQL